MSVGASVGSPGVPMVILPSFTFTHRAPFAGPAPVSVTPLFAPELTALVGRKISSVPPKCSVPRPIFVRLPTRTPKSVTVSVVSGSSTLMTDERLAAVSTVKPGIVADAPVYFSVPVRIARFVTSCTNERSEMRVVPLPAISVPPDAKPARSPNSTVPESR